MKILYSAWWLHSYNTLQVLWCSEHSIMQQVKIMLPTEFGLGGQRKLEMLPGCISKHWRGSTQTSHCTHTDKVTSGAAGATDRGAGWGPTPSHCRGAQRFQAAIANVKDHKPTKRAKGFSLPHPQSVICCVRSCQILSRPRIQTALLPHSQQPGTAPQATLSGWKRPCLHYTCYYKPSHVE